jgi:hypothetical protein
MPSRPALAIIALIARNVASKDNLLRWFTMSPGIVNYRLTARVPDKIIKKLEDAVWPHVVSY